MSQMTATPHSSDTQVGHCKRDTTDTYIGRGPNKCHLNNTPIGDRGWLGNPYPLSDGYSRQESIDAFRDDFVFRLVTDAEFRRAVTALSGNTLGGWCRPLADDDPACHGDVIASWADRLAAESESPIHNQRE